MSESTSLVVPPGKSGGTPLVIDLEKILLAELRQNELGHANKETAPELAVFFNKNWLELNKTYILLNSEKIKAEKELIQREAVIQLDLMKERLALKGVNSTADTRKAVILTDEEYKTLSNLVDEISAATEFIKGKMKGFENSFATAKRIIGENGYMNNQRNPNLAGSTYNPQVIVENKPSRPGFGSSKVR